MDSYNALMTSLHNARWNDMCEPKTLDDIFEAIRKAANKGKFGIIYFGDYHKPEFVPELTQLGFRIIYNDINDILYIMVNANIIRKVAVDNSLNNTKIVVIDSIGEIEDIIISEATKGKFGIFIKNSNLDF
jgi:hypothetical protein